MCSKVKSFLSVMNENFVQIILIASNFIQRAQHIVPDLS